MSVSFSSKTHLTFIKKSCTLLAPWQICSASVIDLTSGQPMPLSDAWGMTNSASSSCSCLSIISEARFTCSSKTASSESKVALSSAWMKFWTCTWQWSNHGHVPWSAISNAWSFLGPSVLALLYRPAWQYTVLFWSGEHARCHGASFHLQSYLPWYKLCKHTINQSAVTGSLQSSPNDQCSCPDCLSFNYLYDLYWFTMHFASIGFNQ